jgi:hypothetical protein
MYPVIPTDLMAGGYELVCYGFTVAAALISYLLAMR